MAGYVSISIHTSNETEKKNQQSILTYYLVSLLPDNPIWNLPADKFGHKYQ